MHTSPENDESNDEEAHRRLSPCFFTTQGVSDADLKEQILYIYRLSASHDIGQWIFQMISGSLIQNKLMI